MKRTLRKNRKYSRKQKGGTTFSTQEKDNLLKDGGFTQEHLDYLATLPEDLGRVFGSVTGTNYDFIKRWQMSVSDMYEIPPTSQNMRELANKTIEDFKFYFDRIAENQQNRMNERQENRMNEREQNNIDISNISDVNISELPSFGGVHHKKQKKSKKQKTTRRKTRRH
jgi:hypothetical protein